MGKDLNITFTDPDHVWINGRQFVSLSRFIEARNSVSEEITILENKIKELTMALNVDGPSCMTCARLDAYEYGRTCKVCKDKKLYLPKT